MNQTTKQSFAHQNKMTILAIIIMFTLVGLLSYLLVEGILFKWL